MRNVTRLRSFLFALPWLVYAAAFLRYVRNAPFEDDYDALLKWLARWLEQADPGDAVRLLFEQHNEHRIVFDRVMLLLQYLLCGRVNFVYLSAIGSAGLWLIVRLYRRRLPPSAAWIAPACALILLAPCQYDLLGFAMAAMQQYWQLLACLGVLLLVAERPTPSWQPLAMLLAVAASFTGAGGLIVFPVGLVVLLRRREWREASGWLLVAAATYAGYFGLLPYHRTDIQIASNHLALAAPLAVLRYCVLFLGSALVGPTPATVAGVALLGVSCVVLVRGLIVGFTFEAAAVMFILATALVAAVGRISLGVEQALASRYSIYSLALVCSLMVYGLRLDGNDRVVRWAKVALAYAVGLLLYAHAAADATRFLAMRAQAMDVAVLYPVPEQGAEVLRTSARMGLYWPPARVHARLSAAQPAVAAAPKAPDLDPGSLCVGAVDSIDGMAPQTTGAMRLPQLGEVAGWLAVRDKDMRPAVAVYLILRDLQAHTERLVPTRNVNRPDVGAAFRDARLAAAGFAATVAPGTLHGSFRLGLGFAMDGRFYTCPKFALLLAID